MSDDRTEITVETAEELLGETDPAESSDVAIDRDGELGVRLAREQYENALSDLRSAWTDADLGRGQKALQRLHGWRAVLNELTSSGGSPTVHIDSLVLADCYQTLFVDPDVESIVYLTGMDISETDATVNRRIPMDHDVQSAVKASGDPDGSFSTLRELDRSDHRLLAHCHNHPGRNDRCPIPSDDDRTYQAQLEGGGYEAIGLIMTVDGYMRVFMNDLEIDVQIHGNHVKQLDERKYFLEEPARNASTRINDA
ncbi:hypothetical protein [Halobaculum sp. EA56]|uniref:hypothetical protein n=1 Tax=Halobaculum sp. EA56 TaxID=3421648 RepID=UPI003EBF6C16